MDAEPTAPHVDYLRLLRRVAANRWKLVLLLFLGVAIPVAVWGLVLAPKTYEAVAIIFIEDSRKEGPVLLRDWIPRSDASFQVAILRSRSLAEGVVENLPRQAMEELLGRAMYRDYFLEAQNMVRRLLGQELIVYSLHQRALAELQKARVRFTPLLSGEVEIRGIAYQPRVAMDLANTFVEVLQTRSRSYTREEARATREFIEGFLNQTRPMLQEAEDALGKLQRSKGAIITAPQRSGVELARLAQLENTLADIQATKEIAKARLNFLRGGKDASGKPLPQAARLSSQQFRERLAQLEEKLATLLEKYTEQHPLVMATQAEIKEVQGNLAVTLQALQEPNPASPIKLGAAERAHLAKQMAALEAEISSLEAKEEILKQRSATLSRSLSTLSAEEMEASKLLRKAETQRNLYNLLSERLSTARIQEQAEGRGLRVIDLAALPLAPSNSQANKILIFGVLLGLGLGVGVAALLEYLRQPIETEEQVTQVTGLPILGWLPTVGRGRRSETNHGPLSFAHTPTSRAFPVEGCRSIRTALESLSRDHALRTIMLASPGPREGKSTVLLNLGWVFWEQGRRLLVVDSDLRRPALHRALGSAARLGLTDLLTSDVAWDTVEQPIEENFRLLPAGASKAANPGALLSSERIRRLLDLIGNRADLVLFDSAPVLAVSDNLILASMVDGVILVVRAGHTQRRDLIRAKAQLDKVGAPLLGVVLNQVSPREARRYYARYADYYDPGDGFRPRKRLWHPRSWWQPQRLGHNGKKGALR